MTVQLSLKLCRKDVMGSFRRRLTSAQPRLSRVGGGRSQKLPMLYMGLTR